MTTTISRHFRAKARRQAENLGHVLSNFRYWSDSAGFQQAIAICFSCGNLIEINDPPKSITGGASKKQCIKRHVLACD